LPEGFEILVGKMVGADFLAHDSPEWILVMSIECSVYARAKHRYRIDFYRFIELADEFGTY